jgi:protein SCO1/2
MRRLVTIIVVGFVVGAFGGLMALIAVNPAGSGGETAGTALIGGPFTLVNQDGKTVTDKDFRGRFMLVFFGYTHCPDICPTELQVMAAAMRKLGDKADRVVPVFITVDPERDTPSELKAYLKNFGDEFVGLTGTDAQIAKVAKEYKVAYSKRKEGQGGNDYSVDHSSIIYLMGPTGNFVDHLTFGVTAPQMAKKLQRYL